MKPEELERLRLAEPTRLSRSRAACRPNSISRVFSAFSSRPNFASLSRSSAQNRSASSRCSNPTTKSSAKRTMITSPCACRRPPLVSPEVKDVVQVDVREQRRNRSPLRNALLERRPRPVLDDPRSQPFLDQPQDPLDPRSGALRTCIQPLMVEAGEVIAEISVEHPVHLLPHDPGRERIQRVMR